MLQAVTLPRVLIVEGRDEESLAEAIRLRHGLQKFDVFNAAGKARLPSVLKSVAKSEAFSIVRRLGIVIDAD